VTREVRVPAGVASFFAARPHERKAQRMVMD
jgi:hypothetical protein